MAGWKFWERPGHNARLIQETVQATIQKLNGQPDPGTAVDLSQIHALFNHAMRLGNVNIDNAAEELAYVFACVEAIGSQMGMAELQVLDRAGGQQVSEDHPLARLLARPHPSMLWEDAAYLAGVQFAVLGRTIWLKEPAEQMTGLRLPDYFTFDDPRAFTRKPTHWEYRPTATPGYVRRVPLEAVMEVRRPSAYNPSAALSTSGALGRVLSQLVAAESFNLEFFKRGARFSMHFHSDGEISPKQRQEVRDRLKDENQGMGKQWNALITSGGLKATPISSSHHDMEFPELDRLGRDKILAVYRVPPVLISAMDSTPYSNAQPQIRYFWLHVILPMLSKLQAWINIAVCVQAGIKERVYFNTRSVQALQRDMAPLALTASSLFDRGIPWAQIDELLELGIDIEALGEFGQTSFIGGGMLPATDVLLGLGGFGGGGGGDEEPDDEGAPDEEDETQRKALTKSDLDEDPLPFHPTGDAQYDADTKVWTKNLEGSRNVQRAYLKRYTAIIKRMRDRQLRVAGRLLREAERATGPTDLSKALAAGSAAVALGLVKTNGSTTLDWLRLPLQTKRSTEEIIAEILREYELTEKELAAWFRNLWDAATKEGVAQIQGNAGFGSTAVPSKAIEVMKQKEIKLSERLGAPKEAVREAILQSFEQSLAGAETPVQAMERVKEAIRGAANSSATRARTITRTETGQMVQSAKNAWMQENGVKHHRWVSARVAETRRDHRAEDGAIVRVGERFPITGLTYPKEPEGPANQVINCLCDAVPLSPEQSARFERAAERRAAATR